jgi:hypothetical protein
MLLLFRLVNHLQLLLLPLLSDRTTGCIVIYQTAEDTKPQGICAFVTRNPAVPAELLPCCASSLRPLPHPSNARLMLAGSSTQAPGHASYHAATVAPTAAAQLSCTTVVPLPFRVWSWAAVTKLYISSCKQQQQYNIDRTSKHHS